MLSPTDLDRHIETLRKGDKLTEGQVKQLCIQAKQILSEQSNVIRLEAPVTVRLPFESRYAEIFTDSSSTCSSSSESEGIRPTQTTCSSGTSQIGD